MSIPVSLAPRLAIERIRSTRGAGVLDAMAVLAFTVTSWLALTVAGGTWMFLGRWQEPGRLTDPEWAAGAPTYVGLAGFACALLVIPVLALGGGAARLGARGRARRLASLRLVGMTGGEVVGVSVIETLVQAALGVTLGSLVYGLSLPAWQLASFQQQPVDWREMLLPWWLWSPVAVTLLVLAVLSTVVGLRQVTISPLGVARQQTPRRLGPWRLVILLVLVVGFMIYARGTDIANAVGLLIVVGFLAIVIGAIALVGPWLLQLAALPATRTRRVPRLLAARRILDDPRAAWRSVATVALLGFIAGFIVTMPGATGGSSVDDYQAAFVADLHAGVAITLSVGLVLAATATLIQQAAGVFDRAPEAIALDRMGVPRAVHASVRRSVVLAPLAVALGTSVPLGIALSLPFAVATDGFPMTGVTILVVTVALGFVLTFAAAEACRPLQAGVLADQRRRND